MSDNMHDRDGWRPATCVESDNIRQELRSAGRLGVSSGLTDLDGNFGPGVVYTEWFDKDTDKPVLRDYRWIEKGIDCEHLVPEVTA